MEKLELSVSHLMDLLQCPLCFWLSQRGMGRPSRPLPGILTQMDRVIKHYMNQFIEHPGGPTWFPFEIQRFVGCRKLEALDDTSKVVLRGTPDAIAIGKDNRCYVVDYKTASPKLETPEYYQLQLDAYAWLLEQNDFAPLGGAYLLYFSPLDSDISRRFFEFDVTAVRVEVNPKRIPPLLLRARNVLESRDPPPPSENCEWCAWRRKVRKFLSEFDADK